MKKYTVEIEQTGDILEEYDNYEQAEAKVKECIAEDMRDKREEKGEELTYMEEHEIYGFYSIYCNDGDKREKVW